MKKKSLREKRVKISSKKQKKTGIGKGREEATKKRGRKEKQKGEELIKNFST